MRIPSSLSSSDQRQSPSIYIGLFVLMQLFIVGVAFLGGYLVRDWRIAGESVPNTGNFAVLSEAYKLLEENALFSLPDPKAMEYGMIRGMLTTVNEPYTVFVEPPQHELNTNQLEGKYGGIGVRIDRDQQGRAILYPFEGSPAKQAGVLEGDHLFRVGDLLIRPETTNDEINSAIRGPVGEEVSITVGHAPGYEPVDLRIKRAEIGLPSVEANLIPEAPRVGMVRINVIADTTPQEVERAVEALQARGATHFLIDVRDNGGGLVEAGVDTAKLFLKEGTVIEEQYKGKPVKTFSVERAGPFAEIPFVVLVNQGTASAAEIFAGAVKSHQRAPIVGTRTYGKDTIQLVFSLSDGSSLHVTSAHWWIPLLEPKVGGNGVQPDVPVDPSLKEPELRRLAIEIVLK